MVEEVEIETTVFEIRVMSEPDRSALVANAESYEDGRVKLRKFVVDNPGNTYRLYAVHFQLLVEISG